MVCMRMIKMKNQIWQLVTDLFALSTLMILLVGCASTPKVKDVGFIFYPPAPNPPLIQYLHSFSNENDVGEEIGSFAKFIVGDEEGMSPITKPYGTAIHDGKIYVVDTRGSGYAIFDLKQQAFNFVVGSGGGVLRKPINIAIDTAGNKYIADTGRNQVIVFDVNDKYVRAYGIDGQFKPSDVALSGNKLFVSDLLNHNIHVLDRQSGAEITTFSSAGSEIDQLFHPTNIDIQGEYLYVADTSNARIQKFTLTGEYVASIGKMGVNLGEFARPKGVAVDNKNRLYVVDAAFENVQIFNDEGKLLMFFGAPGGEKDSINLPTTVAIDYDNVQYFQRYAAPKFQLEYVILVASQFGMNKVNAYGFGRMEGVDYSSVARN